MCECPEFLNALINSDRVRPEKYVRVREREKIVVRVAESLKS